MNFLIHRTRLECVNMSFYDDRFNFKKNNKHT
jgi:hypothetical protein